MQFLRFPKYVLLFCSFLCTAVWTIMACAEAAYLRRLERKEEVLWGDFELHYRLGVDTTLFRIAISKAAGRINRHRHRLQYFRQRAEAYSKQSAE